MSNIFAFPGHRASPTTVDIINSLSAHQKAALADQLRLEATRTNSDKLMNFANLLSRPDLVRRNRKSPYRRLWSRTEMGFVELNKINARYSDEEIERIKRGVAAARELADLMARAAAPILASR
jgi:hypothetical protein